MNRGPGLPTGLLPEAEIVLLAASVGDPTARSDGIRARLEQPLDWELLEETALRNRVVPLVLDGITALGSGGVPTGFLERMQGYARRVKHRNLMILRELLELIQRFEEAGIQVVPYKGPVLATTLYSDLGHRQFRDLDLLVRRESVARAREILMHRGYRPVDQIAPEREAAYLAADCELHFEHPVGRIELELHWRALPRQHNRGFDIDDCWERLEPLTLAGRPVRTFGPADMMLILCMHGGDKHRWERVQMLADVARLATRPDLDWQAVLTRADPIGRRGTILLGCFLAWLLLAAPVPEAIVREFRGQRRLQARASLLRGRAFRTRPGLPSYREWRWYVADQAERATRLGTTIPATMGFLRYLTAVLTPDWTDRQAVALPRALSFLYYLFRPLRMFWRHKGRTLGRI